jgi:hypothetical protein
MEPTNKQAHWEGIIKAWKDSGKKQKVFCEENEINYTTFGYWMKRIKSINNPFTPIKVLTPNRPDQVLYKIETPIGVRVYIPSGAKAEDIHVIFKALGVIA